MELAESSDQHRHHLCISGTSRFNDAVGWINTVEDGYFYNTEHLEKDLLFLCHGKGNWDFEKDISHYADKQATTSNWITQELWARAAWRIVQDNKAESQPFAKTIEKDPMACYSFAIDRLCLAFHSIAFRGQNSVYKQIIIGSGANTERDLNKRLALSRKDHDEDNDAGSKASSRYSDTTSTDETDHDSDEYYVDLVRSPATSFTQSPGRCERLDDVAMSLKDKAAPELIARN